MPKVPNYGGREEYDSPQYKAWRFGILKRDGFICQKCFTPGKKLNSHHIKRWADYPNLRYVQSNGITLCEMCHNLINGKEEEYEQEFKRIVAQKKTDFLNKNPRYNKSTGRVKLKYKQKNPRCFYG